MLEIVKEMDVLSKLFRKPERNTQIGLIPNDGYHNLLVRNMCEYAKNSNLGLLIFCAFNLRILYIAL